MRALLFLFPQVAVPSCNEGGYYRCLRQYERLRLSGEQVNMTQLSFLSRSRSLHHAGPSLVNWPLQEPFAPDHVFRSRLCALPTMTEQLLPHRYNPGPARGTVL